MGARTRTAPSVVDELREAMVQAGPACTIDDADLFTGPDVFEPERPEVRQHRENAAKKVCRSCPARPECLAYALALRPSEGVWGGYAAEEINAAHLLRLDLPPVLEEVA
ncbi:WhiB family transcriptional regulator [Microbispora sp. H10949]|uniref:WhiB family transcriptional regulator n=1 Tax=Microbispora sp. H10949 TaxID=2729111 RepID=UPI002873463A|nr:WhiB family transcriptional regulator [Microbispora sp. H10949]